jgi:hypothetical protein
MIGRCHLCLKAGLAAAILADQDVEFCDACGHYFCEGCRGKWFDRTVEFVKKLLGREFVGCCGPKRGVPLAQAV